MTPEDNVSRWLLEGEVRRIPSREPSGGSTRTSGDPASAPRQRSGVEPGAGQSGFVDRDDIRGLTIVVEALAERIDVLEGRLNELSTRERGSKP